MAAILLAVLSGCGGAGTPAEESTAATATAKTVPDVTGKSFPVANNLLNNDGLSAVAFGKDGKEWKSLYPADAKVLSSDPVAGSSTEKKLIRLNVDINEADQAKVVAAEAKEAAKAEAAAAAKAKAEAEKAALAVRYEFTCGSSYEDPAVLNTLQQVWSSTYYKDSGACSVTIDGADPYEKPALLPSEQAIVALVKSKGGDTSIPASTFADVLLLCAKVDPGYADEVVANPTWRKADAQGALKLCPKAPHAQLFRDALTSVKIDDGNHIVGKDMEPGTYVTKPGSKDCYWSRNTGGGDIIANDFVGFAPDGVTVTTFAGEGFESNGCGVWTKVG